MHHTALRLSFTCVIGAALLAVPGLPVDAQDRKPVPETSSGPASQPTESQSPKSVRTMRVFQDGAVPERREPTPVTTSDPRKPIDPFTVAPPASEKKTVQTTRVLRDGAANASADPYVVLLSAQRTEDQVRTAFKALQTRYSDLLGSHEPVVRRAYLGDQGTYYRVMVGPCDTREQANDLCERLKAAGGMCIVARM